MRKIRKRKIPKKKLRREKPEKKKNQNKNYQMNRNVKCSIALFSHPMYPLKFTSSMLT